MMTALNDAARQNAVSDMAALITDAAERLFRDHGAPTMLHALGHEWPQALWNDLVEAGLLACLEPTGSGALGIPLSAAMEIARAVGRCAVPGPLVETMLANWLLQRAGREPADGALGAAPLHADEEVALRREGDGWRLNGSVTRIPWGRALAAVVLVAAVDGQDHVALVPVDPAIAAPGSNIAGEPRDTLKFDLLLPAYAVTACLTARDDMIQMGAALRAMQMAGAMETILASAVDHVRDRVQFGRPIGKFQAVQQNLAVMASQTAAARAAADLAARVMNAGGSTVGIAAVKVRVGEAATIAARLAHQVHGAMGFAQEHTLHHFTRRLWSWRDEFGGDAAWARQLGALLCANGADSIWSTLSEIRAAR